MKSRVKYTVSGTASDEEDTDPSLLKKQVELRDGKNFESEYKVDEFLGSGNFGDVRRCHESSSGRHFAAKFVPFASSEDLKTANNEIAIMNRMKHPRLIQLYDAVKTKEEVVLILELITGGELFQRIIDESFDLNETRCIKFMKEILQGVEYMHANGVVHLDLKPENVLCLSATSFKTKIIDFGLSRFYDGSEMCVLFGTLEFISPEVISYEPVGPPADMWSLGVICYVMLSGLSPFMGDSSSETMANILKVKYDFDYPEFDEISEDARNFIKSLLVKNPRKRMTAKECLEHSWLNKRTKLKRKGTVSKKRLRHFVYRRKWQKAVNAIIALQRMGVVLHHNQQKLPTPVGSPSPVPDTSKTGLKSTFWPVTINTSQRRSSLLNQLSRVPSIRYQKNPVNDSVNKKSSDQFTSKPSTSSNKEQKFKLKEDDKKTDDKKAPDQSLSKPSISNNEEQKVKLKDGDKKTGGSKKTRLRSPPSSSNKLSPSDTKTSLLESSKAKPTESMISTNHSSTKQDQKQTSQPSSNLESVKSINQTPKNSTPGTTSVSDGKAGGKESSSSSNSQPNSVKAQPTTTPSTSKSAKSKPPSSTTKLRLPFTSDISSRINFFANVSDTFKRKK